MSIPRRFHWESTFAYPIEEVFGWHTRSGAFERLNPPWRPVAIIDAPETIAPGTTVKIRIPLLGSIGIPWRLRHSAYTPPFMFQDEQLQGPFRSWKHTHNFRSESPRSTTILDEIDYELPLGTGPLNRFVQKELTRLFTHRHRILASDLALHERWRHLPRKTILVAGASGFVGKATCAFLSTAGHVVHTLVRRTPRSPHEHHWNPDSGELNPHVFDGIDVVINLSGENIASSRWSDSKKTTIKESRVRATTLLSITIAALPQPPEVLISASGIGFYGDTGTAIVTETSPRGSDFLAHVCEAWESASSTVEANGCRNVQLRIGMVLNAAGGALQKMLPAFYCGIAGRLGNGRQSVSWISLQDLLGIIEHIIYTPELQGPVNCVSPEPCTNREFTQSLAQVLRRPAILPIPEYILILLFGEMAALFLTSCRALPSKLQESRYHFTLGNLSEALAFECGR